MNKRIVLWIVFLMSLLLLWERWQTFNGKPSMFFPSATQTQVAKHDVTKSGTPDAPVAAVTGVADAVPANTAAVPVKGEVITIITDLYKAEIDTVGGELCHLELLNQKEDIDTSFGSGFKALFGTPVKHGDAPNVVLFDRSEKRTYLAQSGLIDLSTNHVVLPDHHTLFAAQPGSDAGCVRARFNWYWRPSKMASSW